MNDIERMKRRLAARQTMLDSRRARPRAREAPEAARRANHRIGLFLDNLYAVVGPLQTA